MFTRYLCAGAKLQWAGIWPWLLNPSHSKKDWLPSQLNWGSEKLSDLLPVSGGKIWTQICVAPSHTKHTPHAGSQRARSALSLVQRRNNSREKKSQATRIFRERCCSLSALRQVVGRVFGRQNVSLFQPVIWFRVDTALSENLWNNTEYKLRLKDTPAETGPFGMRI